MELASKEQGLQLILKWIRGQIVRRDTVQCRTIALTMAATSASSATTSLTISLTFSSPSVFYPGCAAWECLAPTSSYPG